MCVGVSPTCTSVYPMYTVLAKVKKGIWKWSNGQLLAAMWSSVRAANKYS